MGGLKNDFNYTALEIRVKWSDIFNPQNKKIFDIDPKYVLTSRSILAIHLAMVMNKFDKSGMFDFKGKQNLQEQIIEELFYMLIIIWGF